MAWTQLITAASKGVPEVTLPYLFFCQIRVWILSDLYGSYIFGFCTSLDGLTLTAIEDSDWFDTNCKRQVLSRTSKTSGNYDSRRRLAICSSRNSSNPVHIHTLDLSAFTSNTFRLVISGFCLPRFWCIELSTMTWRQFQRHSVMRSWTLAVTLVLSIVQVWLW